MSEQSTQTTQESNKQFPIIDNQNKKPEKKYFTLSCACCNQDIVGNKYIGIVHYGTMIYICGQPCGIRDYLETQ